MDRDLKARQIEAEVENGRESLSARFKRPDRQATARAAANVQHVESQFAGDSK